MPLSEATISYDLADLTGVDFDARRTKVWASTNIPGDTVIDTDGNKIRLGSGTSTVSADGTGTISVWAPGAGSNPASWQTYIHVDYPDRQSTGGRGKRTFGPFTITGSANLADLVDEQEVPATYITALTQELDGYATAAANSAAVAQSAAELATTIVGIDTTDAAVAAGFQTPGSQSGAYLAATYAQIVSVLTFVQPGETLVRDGSGVGNNTAIIQRAVNALNALWVADGVPRKLHFPPGSKIRLAKGGDEGTRPYCLRWLSGVGIATDLPRDVTFYAPADATPFYAAYTFGNIEHVYCDSHVVDGYAQTHTSYTTQRKGWFVQGMNHFRFDDLLVRGTWATGFGCDFLRDGKVTGHAEGCGRGLIELGANPLAESGGSGFGIGTGKYEVEDFELDVTAANCGFHGVFTETQPSATFQQSKGSRIRARVTGNFVGFRDCGSEGLVADIVAEGNTYADVLHTGTVLHPTAGIDGTMRVQLTKGGKGIVIGNASAGPYLFTGTNRESVGDGVHFLADAILAPGITFDLVNERCGGSGYLIRSPQVIKSLSVRGSARNNGQNTGATYRDGVTVLAATDLLDLDVRATDDQTTPTQQRGVALVGAGTNAARARLRGDVRGSATPTVLEHTISADSSLDLTGSDTTGPSRLRASVVTTGTAIALTWDAPIPTTGVTDYEIQYRTSPGGTWTTFAHTASTATSRTVTGLTNDVAYDFHVAAVTGGVTGPYTAGPVTATPMPAPMHVDTFDRADNATSLGSTDGGTSAPQAWTVTGGTAWGIFSGFARAASGGLSVARLTGAANGIITARHSTFKSGASRETALVFRHVDDSNYWMVTASAGNNWRLQKRVGGTNTTPAGGDLGISPASMDVVRVRFVGSSIQVYINDVLRTTVTDSALSTGTGVGFRGKSDTDAESRWGYGDGAGQAGFSFIAL